MNKRKVLCCILLLVLFPALGAGVLCAVPEVGWQVQLDLSGVSGAQPPQPQGAMAELRQIALDVWSALSPGSTVEAKDFASTFPAHTANRLSQAGITRIARKGDRIEMELSREYEHHFQKVDVKFARRIAFDVTQSQGDLEVRNMEGVKVHAKWFLGWMDLKDLSFARQPNGNTLLTAKVTVWFKPGKATYKVTLGPDGKVLSS